MRRRFAGIGTLSSRLKWRRPTVVSWLMSLRDLRKIYDVGVAWLLGEAPDTLDARDPAARACCT
jgi:hypothetical protein